ncbi:MAG TPA: ABC transporter substrate binding protein, partial [Pyrinomonadaceae bacterium]|nr:ABC transporter substrate binding protein [Pyrinomonadaceae bacterium]
MAGILRRPIKLNFASPVGKVLACSLITSLYILSAQAASADELSKKVLIFSSDSHSVPGNMLLDQAVSSTVRKGLPAGLQVFYEALDTFRIPNEKYEQEMVRLLQRKYSEQPIDLIYAYNRSALRFLLKHRGELFSNTPVVFIAYEMKRVADLSLDAQVTGVGGRVELSPTLDIALALQPQTERVVVVAGKMPADTAFVEQARQEFSPYEGKVEFVYLIGLPIEEVRTRLASLPDNSIVFYLWVSSDSTPQISSNPELISLLAPSSSAPIYGTSQTYLGNGMIGGRLVDFEALGTRAGEMGLRILAGDSPQNIPPQTVPSTTMFDWRELRRWSIDETRLPPGSVVRYREFSVWELYKWRIIGAISIIVLQAVGIGWLLFTRAKRRQAEEAKNNLAAIVETSDDAILSNTLEGIIISWNAGAEKIYGYSASEIVGQPVWTLAPPELKGEVEGILERLGRGEIVDHLETQRVSKEGMRIDVSLTISPIRNERSIIIGASTIARDITARKKAEVEGLQHREELAHLSRVTMLGELSGSLAHELNQPLTAILSNAQAAKRFLEHDSVDLDEVRDILTDIVDQDIRAGEVIHRLRLLLKKGEVDQQPLDVNNTVQEVLKLIHGDLVNQSITMHTQLAPGLPTVKGDRVQLQQVLLNLVMNASDAMNRNSSTDRQLTVFTGLSDGEGVRFSVSDCGSG